MARLLFATTCVSAWLLLLLVGWAAGGAVHLLLAAGLVLFPWSKLRRDAADHR